MRLTPRCSRFRLSFLCLGLATGSFVDAAPWEAESARLRETVTLLDDASASGGRALQFAGAGHAAWTVNVATAGRYELHLRYRTATEAGWPKLTVNGHTRGLGLDSTLGEWSEVSRIVTLRAGDNEIALAANRQRFDADLLRLGTPSGSGLVPAYEFPVLSPRTARVDRRAPQPLLFLLRGNGHRVARVTLAGRELSPSFVPFAPVEDAAQMTIPAPAIADLPAGTHPLRIDFVGGAEVSVPVEVSSDPVPAPLLIASLDVSHGKATLIRLPDGQVALIDCAQASFAQSHLLPFLAAHGIARIDHLFLTHYHDDHAGGLDLLKAALPVGAVHDYRDYRSGDRFTLGGVDWFVLNAYADGSDENSRSLSLQLTYRGFVYTDGADIYAQNQAAILERFPERVRSHVYYGNHHFHGSVDVNYLRRTDAALYLVSAEDSVYARAAYAQSFVRDVAGYLKAHDRRLRETLVTRETGHCLIRVHDADRWTYETAPVGAVFPDFVAP